MAARSLLYENNQGIYTWTPFITSGESDPTRIGVSSIGATFGILANGGSVPVAGNVTLTSFVSAGNGITLFNNTENETELVWGLNLSSITGGGVSVSTLSNVDVNVALNLKATGSLSLTSNVDNSITINADIGELPVEYLNFFGFATPCNVLVDANQAYDLVFDSNTFNIPTIGTSNWRVDYGIYAYDAFDGTNDVFKSDLVTVSLQTDASANNLPYLFNWNTQQVYSSNIGQFINGNNYISAYGTARINGGGGQITQPYKLRIQAYSKTTVPSGFLSFNIDYLNFTAIP